MKDDAIAARFEFAQALAREAGAFAEALRIGTKPLSVVQKGRQDFASQADRATEDFLVSRIAAAFPEDGKLGEEGGLRGKADEAFWTLDPIDGTANYLRGLPLWCVSIAFVRAGVAEIGVTYCPSTGELFAARRGHGASCNGRPCRASAVGDADRAAVALGFSHAGSSKAYADLVHALIVKGFDYRRLGSTALSLALVADGRLDGFFKAETKAWDALPGLLLVAEAGGRTSAYAASAAILGWADPVLAAAPGIWDEFSEVLGFSGAPGVRPE